ncbi:Transmembrane protein EpsG [Chryseobacterium oranimense G311]|uniref:EpsG family protein n=1 Tax=Chryseobacterium oranimense TaxID=421058 RepID=UPI00053390D2|nr:EpsG family protein [Chryseobacterium oranimense]CEJ70999.1 Transmembrane protein EpsG [Chryseobacterium oranimense G311]
MAAYIILYLFSVFLSFYSYLKENTSKIPFLIFFIILGIFAGSRFNIGGSDYMVYELMYENTDKDFSDVFSPDYFLLMATEKGYIVLMSVFNYLGADFNTFLLFLGITCSIGLYFIFTRYSNIYGVLLMIFFAKGFLYYFFTAQRQIIAMIICWLAIKFVVERKFLKFFLMVILASLFHTSAIMFLVIYFFCNIKIDNKKAIILLIISIALGALKIGTLIGMQISSFLPFGAEKLTDYLEEEGAAGANILNFIEIIPVLFVILMSRHRIESKIKYFNLFFNLYVFFVMITFAFYDFAFIARLKGYFVIGYIVILSSLLYIPNKKTISVGILLILAFYCFAVYTRELLVFDNGEGYLPYKSYFFKDF